MFVFPLQKLLISFFNRSLSIGNFKVSNERKINNKTVLSDNNNNTIIIWSITYSQLYLIKAVISLRVSGNSKPQELYHPYPSVGDYSCSGAGWLARRPQKPEATSRVQLPESERSRPGATCRGGSAVASGQRPSLEPLRRRARVSSGLRWLMRE